MDFNEERDELPERGVIVQIKRAFSRSSALATSIGFLLGSFIPVSTYVLTHHELDKEHPLYTQVLTYVIVGGLAYSAITVYSWALLAFKSRVKALAFVVLLEGTMVVSSNVLLNSAALFYLAFVNGTATGCTLAEDESREAQSAEEELASASQKRKRAQR